MAVAVIGCLLLGSLDLLAQRTLPHPRANLANSSAIWALGAFGIGVWSRARGWRPAAVGIPLPSRSGGPPGSAWKVWR